MDLNGWTDTHKQSANPPGCTQQPLEIHLWGVASCEALPSIWESHFCSNPSRVMSIPRHRRGNFITFSLLPPSCLNTSNGIYGRYIVIIISNMIEFTRNRCAFAPSNDILQCTARNPQKRDRWLDRAASSISLSSVHCHSFSQWTPIDILQSRSQVETFQKSRQIQPTFLHHKIPHLLLSFLWLLLRYTFSILIIPSGPFALWRFWSLSWFGANYLVHLKDSASGTRCKLDTPILSRM